MNRRVVPYFVSLSFCLLLLTLAVPAAASTQHTVTLEWVFSGTSCPLSTVVVSASSCDGQDIADELVSEITSAGLSSSFCGYSVNDQWECLASFPSSCTLVDSTMSLKPGLSCTYDNVEGQMYGPIGTYLVYIFNVP